MVVEMFKTIVTGGIYVIGYLEDGGTHHETITCDNWRQAMIIFQNKGHNICDVTYVEEAR